jgi:hypothetical protein
LRAGVQRRLGRRLVRAGYQQQALARGQDAAAQTESAAPVLTGIP